MIVETNAYSKILWFRMNILAQLIYKHAVMFIDASGSPPD